MRGTLNDQSLIYLQIARMLEDDVLRGVYRAQEQAPSTNALARSLNVNPATAAKGLNLLAAEGVLYKKRGLGMFVAEGAADTIRKKRRSAFVDEYVGPLVREGRSLGLTAEEIQELVRAGLSSGQNS